MSEMTATRISKGLTLAVAAAASAVRPWIPARPRGPRVGAVRVAPDAHERPRPATRRARPAPVLLRAGARTGPQLHARDAGVVARRNVRHHHRARRPDEDAAADGARHGARADRQRRDRRDGAARDALVRVSAVRPG